MRVESGLSSAFERRRVVVTGGCGFIGSDFARHVVREHPGVHVTVQDKLTYAGNPDIITVGAHRRLGLGVILDAQRKWFICT